jgi:hypothetical protein
MRKDERQAGRSCFFGRRRVLNVRVRARIHHHRRQRMDGDGVVRCGQAGGLNALAGWGPARGFHDALDTVMQGRRGRRMESVGRGSDPAGVLWITQENRLLLMAGAFPPRNGAVRPPSGDPPTARPAANAVRPRAQPEAEVYTASGRTRRGARRYADLMIAKSPMKGNGRRTCRRPVRRTSRSGAPADPRRRCPIPRARHDPDLMGTYRKKRPLSVCCPVPASSGFPVECGEE